MSCNCNKGGGGSCGCEKTISDGTGINCNGDKTAYLNRLERFRVCEPYCDNGGCKPKRRRMTATRVEVTCRDLFAHLLKLGVAVYTTTEDGPAIIIAGVRNAAGELTSDSLTVPTNLCEAVCACSFFGPSFNAEARASEYSPNDVEAIAKAYGYETPAMTPASSIGGGWYAIALGALGASHVFCLDEIVAQDVPANGGAATPLIVTAVAIGGERVACGDGDPGADEGSYVRVFDTPVEANPRDIKTTEYRCKCVNLCAWTPARGAEFFYVKFSTAPAGIVQVQPTVQRCDFLSVPEAESCVGPMGARVVATSGHIATYTGDLRTTAGAPPFLPGATFP